MNDPTPHGNGHGFNFSLDASTFQGLPSPVTQGKIDGSSTDVTSFSRVGSALIDVNVVAALLKVKAPEAADQSGANDVGFFHEARACLRVASKRARSR